MIWLGWIWRLSQAGLSILGLLAVVAGVMLAIPVEAPPVLASIQTGALAIDQTGMPEPSRFHARDGSELAYRLYPATDGGRQKIAVLIHGSGAGSPGMNQIAKALAGDGFIVVSPDMRGHGSSGTRGDIAYSGQLDDDLEDLVAELRRQFSQARFTLLGFSSGGGYALRVAAGKLGSDFDRLILLSPYLGHDAASTRPHGSPAVWANPDVPRIIALTALRRLGLPCCEALPVVAFAVAPQREKFVTARYSYRLLMNFSAPPDLNAALLALKMPATILAGAQDELMVSDKYAEIVRASAEQGNISKVDVRILPGLNHIDMLHAAPAIDALRAAFKE
jgi:pimeloyl-ACP methyl ester carboxylesterase